MIKWEGDPARKVSPGVEARTSPPEVNPEGEEAAIKTRTSRTVWPNEKGDLACACGVLWGGEKGL